MPPKSNLKSKEALKPGTVSYAPADWDLVDNDDKSGFTTVKKKGQKKDQANVPIYMQQAQQRAQQNAQNQPQKPQKPAVTPYKPAATVQVASAQATKEQKQHLQKQRMLAQQREAQKAQQAAAGDDDWTTVSKSTQKPVAKQENKMKSDKHIKGEQDKARRMQIQQQNSSVVGAGQVLTDEQVKAKKKEEKKRQKELEQQRLKQQQKAQEKLNQKHEDPNAGFVKAKNTVKATKVAAPIDSFGVSTAFTKLKKGNQASTHVKVPKPQKEREVAEMTEEQKQLLLKQKTKTIQEAELDFMVLVQDRWYSVASLLGANNFEHAPKLVQSVVNQSKIVGGLYISVDNKHFANEHTVDEWWMAMNYIKAMTKLLGNLDEEVTFEPYWTTEKSGKDPTVILKANKPSFEANEDGVILPTLTLSHKQKHGAPLQEIQPTIHQFATALLDEARLFEKFLTHIHSAIDQVAGTKKWKSKEKAADLQAFKSNLPSKVEELVDTLEEALAEFEKKYPVPDTE